MRIFHSIAPRWAVLDLFIVVSSWWEVFVEAWCHGSNYRDLGRFPKRLVSGISWGPLGNQLKMLGYNQLIYACWAVSDRGLLSWQVEWGTYDGWFLLMFSCIFHVFSLNFPQLLSYWRWKAWWIPWVQQGRAEPPQAAAISALPLVAANGKHAGHHGTAGE